jgi:hypothetical protein
VVGDAQRSESLPEHVGRKHLQPQAVVRMVCDGQVRVHGDVPRAGDMAGVVLRLLADV